MDSPTLPPMKRAVALLVSGLLLTGGVLAAPSMAQPATAAEDYRGAVVEGRGAVLGSTAHTPPSGAVFVSSVSGSDSNSGSVNSPLRTVAKAVTVAPTGGTVVLRAGTYHEAVTVKKQLTIQNYPREVVWFDGSKVVSSWSASGSVWTAPWTTFFGVTNTPGGLRTGYPYANRPAQVFLDGQALTEVGSFGEVGPGKFYPDAANRRLVIGNSPVGKEVRASVLDRALWVGAQNVNMRGFGVRRYATSMATRGAILMDPDGGTFEDLVVSDNAVFGLTLTGANKTVRRITVERNGMMGLVMDRAKDMVLADSLIRYNNFERFPTLPVASGVKITWATRPKITNNIVSETYLANGLWLDGYAIDPVITGNKLENNGENQLNLETSTGGFVANNVMIGGRRAIDIRDTNNVRVMNNHIRDYTLMGVQLAQDDRYQKLGDAPPGFTLRVQNVTLANNVFACGTRFQIFGRDEAKYGIPMDDFKMTITGNVFSPQGKNPELNLAAWGLREGVEFIQTVDHLHKKGSGWKNLQATTCQANPQTGFAADTLATLAMPIPQDIAAAIGVPSGTRAVGVIGGAVPQPAPPKNAAPVAKLAVSSDGLTMTADASGSTDSDGSIASYEWDLGDGRTATGRRITHQYAAPGIFRVKLTVKDDRGAQGTAATDVTVRASDSAPKTSTKITDAFERSTARGWGSTDTGQTWELTGGLSEFSTGHGHGLIALKPANNREARIPFPGTTSTSTTRFSLENMPTSGAVTVTQLGRQVGGSYYGGRLRIGADGSARLYALKDETPLGNTSYLLPGRYVPGMQYVIKTRVTGTSPTRVQVKIWAAGSVEPAAWRLSATDATPSLQAPGRVGVKAYLGSSGTATVRVRVHDVAVVADA